MLDDGRADHLRSGLSLPPIALPSTEGGTVDLAALPGRFLLIVYPWTGRPGQSNPPNWDDIPGAHGSTPELEGFRDRQAEFTRSGVSLFALSSQATDYQRELVGRLRLPFPILSDDAGRFTTALCLPTFTAGGDLYLKRLTLQIGTGRIDKVFYPVADPPAHAAELLRGLEAGS